MKNPECPACLVEDEELAELLPALIQMADFRVCPTCLTRRPFYERELRSMQGMIDRARNMIKGAA